MRTNSIRCRLWSIYAAALSSCGYALLNEAYWPSSFDAHLILRRIGLAYGGVLAHPIWSAYAASFGPNAALVSVLSGGGCVGIFAWLAFRWLGWRAGMLATVAFATSAPVVMSATRVDASLFDCLLALTAVASFGKNLKWIVSLILGVILFIDLLQLGLVNPGGLALDGVPASVALAVLVGLLVKRLNSRKVFIGMLVLLCVSLVVTRQTLARDRNCLADRIAEVVLSNVGADCRWLVTDTSLEEALARRLSLRSDGPYLIRTGCDTNRAYCEELARQAVSAFPGDVGLRKAAELGVRPFLEDLPIVETNEARIVYVWSRRLWTQEMIAKVESELQDDEYSKCVRQRIVALRERGDGEDRIVAATGQRLRELGAGWDQMASRLGEALKKGDYAALRNEMRHVLRTDRANPLGNALMGALVARAGDYCGAELFLRRAVASGRAPPLVVNDLAETLRRMRKLDEAEQFARQALVAQPDSRQIRNTLATILRDRKRIAAVEYRSKNEQP